MDKMDQMMGNLFYRGAGPDEIENMSYSRMRYWNRWHELMVKAETPKPKKGK